MPDGSSASPAARAALRPENIPQSLKNRRSWCVWRYGPERANGKRPKIPYQPDGKPAKSNDATTWHPFAACLKAYQRGKFNGVGIFLSGNLAGIDLDNCRDGDGANEAAAEILGQFAATYQEVSPSGTGYRVLCLGKPQRSGKNAGQLKWLECYAEPSSRFLTVTGDALTPGAEVTEQQAALDWLHARHMAGDATTHPPPVLPNHAAAWRGDAELLDKAMRDGDFAALWRGDTTGYGNDNSAADMALCGRLAWWCNGDAAQVDRLFRLSALYRDKWDSRRGDTTYGAHTVAVAIANCSGGYTGQRPDGGATSHAEASGGAAGDGTGKHSGGGAAGAGEPSHWFTGATLLRTQFADPVWLLPGLLPDTGVFLLSGKPKLGKSWFALALAMAVAQGGRFLGRNVPQGRVLYLALEDTPRRLKSRLLTLQPDCERNPDGLAALALRNDAPRLGKGLEALLEKALSAGGIRLVVIDTLQRVRQPGSGGNQYQDDYAALSALKQTADRHNTVFLVVHHLRKQEADDVHDCVSGTLGITGAADGSLVLTRQRGDGAAVLSVTGRDMEESEHGLRFEKGLWTYAGTAAEVKASAEQNEVYEALKPYGSDGATVNQVCEDTGKQRRNASKLLGRLIDAGRVRVRHMKPAPRYAICDGPGRDGSTSTPPHTQEREESENAVPPVPPVPPVPHPADRVNAGGGGTAGTAGTLGECEPDKPGTRLNTGVAGSGGTAGTAGTAGTENWFEV